MKKSMNLSLLALLIGAAFTPVGHAAQADEPRPIFVRLKAEAPNPALRTASNPDQQQAMDALRRLTPSMRPLVTASPSARNASADDLAALERHNLTRYYEIPAEALRGVDAQALVDDLLSNPLVDSAQIEPVAVSALAEGMEATVAVNAMGGIPDYTDCSGAKAATCQGYMSSVQPLPGRKLGGLNAFEAQRLTGHYGENVRMISNEIDHWDYDHIDLPRPFLQHNDPKVLPGDHDTQSVGILFGQDNGFGITGFVPKAQAGYSRWGVQGLIDLRHHLKAGDVMHIGVQYTTTNGCGPGITCHLPVENVDAVFDAISYLVKEKGVHVILAASNGAANLDDPWYNGRFDRRIRDSGAIYVGGADPKAGDRAGYSAYGSRVDTFSWGWNVTTTTWVDGKHDLYTHHYAGTSSANPIIAGGVAWLQSLARERGLGNIPPKTMRKLIVDSGNPLPIVDPARPIGVQPDLVRAMELLGGDSEGGLAPQAHVQGPANAQAGETVVLSASGSSGKDLKYDWSSQPALTFAKQGAQASFVAPDAAQDIAYRITLKVTDSRGRTSTSHHGIQVKAKPAAGVCTAAPAWDSKRTYNVPGEAVVYKGKIYRQNYWNVNAAPDVNSAQWGKPWKLPEDCAVEPPPIPMPVAKISGPTEVKAMELVTLSASASTGQGLKFAWESLDGMPVSASGNTATFTAPPLGEDRSFSFKLTVTDERGRTATASHVVKVKAKVVIPEVIAPEAKLSGPAKVKGGDRVTLSGKASVGTDLRYRWTVPAGISASSLDQAELSFVAPTATKDTSYRFMLTVSNSRGEAQASHTVTVTGQPVVGGIPQYQAGAIYKEGDKVMNGGKTYECRGWPYTGWCSQSPAHYAPGTGSHWRDAWLAR